MKEQKKRKKGLLIGYARVSTLDQDPQLQIDALTDSGVDERHLYQDKASGSTKHRPALQDVLSFLKEGDILVVWRLDRLGRSLLDLISIITELEKRGVGFMSLTENIDTTTAGGKLIFHIFGALAEFEREMIRERTIAGLKAAKKQGRVGGRPRALNLDQVELLKSLSEEGKEVSTIARILNTSRFTVYRELKKR